MNLKKFFAKYIINKEFTIQKSIKGNKSPIKMGKDTYRLFTKELILNMEKYTPLLSIVINKTIIKVYVFTYQTQKIKRLRKQCWQCVGKLVFLCTGS